MRFTYLNAAKTKQAPQLWLDILHKGVRTKFSIAQPTFLGVPQFSAAQAGSVLGVFDRSAYHRYCGNTLACRSSYLFYSAYSFCFLGPLP